MVSNRKSRKNSRRNRKNRRNNNMSMRRRRNNMMGGEYSMPAPVNDESLKGPSAMSMAQGQQFADFHKNQHGGGLTGGPYPGVVTEEALLPSNMAASARIAPLNAALNEIRGMSDQAGGRRRRRNTMARRNRKNARRTNRKNRKNTRRNRKNRKNTMRRRRNNMMGGAVLTPASVSAPGLLLPSGLEAKAVSGMNAEWKLAENPRAFAPGL